MIKTDIPTSDALTEREIRHEQLSEKIAGESVVLLKNNGVLPLGKTPVALYGAGARGTVTGGTGSGRVNSRRDINIETGLSEAGFSVLTGDWLSAYAKKREEAFLAYKERARIESEESGMPHNLVMMHKHFHEPAPLPIGQKDLYGDRTDTAIYVIARHSGEGADRLLQEGDYYLYKEEKENLEALSRAYKRIVVILNIGGVIDLKDIASLPYVDAILLMGQLGNIGGRVIAEVLTGQIVPSGKLSDTWAYDYSDYPSAENFSHNNGDVNDEYYQEGIFVGYRYFDTAKKEPLYPFGFGLSYTDFVITGGAVGIYQDTVSVKATVTNTGARYAGKEVVQVYISKPAGTLPQAYQELITYKKTDVIKPGEAEELTLDFSLEDLASFSEAEAAYVLPAGDYVIRLGNSSRHTEVIAVLTVREQITVRALKNFFQKDRDFAETELTAEQTKAPNGVLRLVIDPAVIAGGACAYTTERKTLTAPDTEVSFQDVCKGEKSAEALVSQLTLEELCSFAVGTERPLSEDRKDQAGNAAILGHASKKVPGAAGDTSSIAYDKYGIPNIVMADGPAGLRLMPHFKTKQNGELVDGGEIVGGKPLPFDSSIPASETIDYYQYCTALPVGFSLAQSWNDALLYEAGAIVGAEMELFGINLWLAPALNIHRNPLCGRNYEYYSEDPLLSGKTAAAITRGVQSHAGRGVTLKHFAANNQEDNRYFTNAHISERALREIYLKGFEIAVKEAAPYAIMTSYNLINGVHAANRHDLLQSVLRDEWGFDGLVMTDWCSTWDEPAITGENHSPYPIASAVGCVYAGNDLQMPGCLQNIRDIAAAVAENKEIDGYTITKADLQFCVLNVVKTVVKAGKA